MMKKLALAAVLAVGSTAAFADRDAGCGIGSQVWAGLRWWLSAQVGVAAIGLGEGPVS